MLLIHHKKLDKWLQPGGHIELDEDPLQALYREVYEETGIEATDLEIVELTKDRRHIGRGSKLLPIPFDLNVHAFSMSHKHIDLCYLMRSKTNKLRLEEEAAHDIGWFSIEDMVKLKQKGLLYEDTIELAKLALKHA